MFRKIKLVNNVETLLNIYNPKGGGGWRATIRMEKHFINDTSGSHFHADPSRGNLLLLCRFPSDIFYLYFVLNQSWKVIYWKICKLNFFLSSYDSIGERIELSESLCRMDAFVHISIYSQCTSLMEIRRTRFNKIMSGWEWRWGRWRRWQVMWHWRPDRWAMRNVFLLHNVFNLMLNFILNQTFHSH